MFEPKVPVKKPPVILSHNSDDYLEFLVIDRNSSDSLDGRQRPSRLGLQPAVVPAFSFITLDQHSDDSFDSFDEKWQPPRLGLQAVVVPQGYFFAGPPASEPQPRMDLQPALSLGPRAPTNFFQTPPAIPAQTPDVSRDAHLQTTPSLGSRSDS